jgi:hypothetical protein
VRKDGNGKGHQTTGGRRKPAGEEREGRKNGKRAEEESESVRMLSSKGKKIKAYPSSQQPSTSPTTPSLSTPFLLPFPPKDYDFRTEQQDEERSYGRRKDRRRHGNVGGRSRGSSGGRDLFRREMKKREERKKASASREEDEERKKTDPDASQTSPCTALQTTPY